MLDIQTYMKKYYKNDIDINPSTIPESAESAVKCCLCEKQFGERTHIIKSILSSS